MSEPAAADQGARPFALFGLDQTLEAKEAHDAACCLRDARPVDFHLLPKHSGLDAGEVH